MSQKESKTAKPSGTNSNLAQTDRDNTRSHADRPNTRSDTDRGRAPMPPLELDPRTTPDWQIAEAAESRMRTVRQLADHLGLEHDELIPMGEYIGKVDATKIMNRLADQPLGRYVDVTAITPTPLGEGKTTTTMGLIQGLGQLGYRVSGAIRQPSGGPTFNIKGSAAGGGLAQCIPMTPLSIRLTGDIDSITNAHNLAMVALTARMQHEHNYDDDRLASIGLKRLDIDPEQVTIRWAIDFCAQALRHITIGKGGKMDGYEMDSGFQISVSSEIMAILAVATDLADLRRRIGKMVVAYSRSGQPVTTEDLEVAGAMTAWLVEALKPNLMQTLEGQPVFVHAGPFANIAIGQSSIIADQIGLRLSDYHVTESGFAADIGYEKYWNLKCRYSGLTPDAVVIIATIRALKMHGGGPPVKPGATLHEAYRTENIPLLRQGIDNLLAHIEIVSKSGIRPIVCINHFHTDTDEELNLVRSLADAHGARTVCSYHWLKGGPGASELAKAVVEESSNKNHFQFLYDTDMPLHKRIERVAMDVYGANGVSYTSTAMAKLKRYEADPEISRLGLCMVKTHLSLSHDANFKGRPRGWELPIRDFLIYKGAGFIVPVAGDIKLLPGTGSNPQYRRIDVDVNTGKVTGLM